MSSEPKAAVSLTPLAVFMAGFCALLIHALPLLTGQFSETHEHVSYLLRTEEFSRQLSEGEFYPRWCPNFDSAFGYPFFVFYAPGYFYLASVPRLLGVPPMGAQFIVIVFAQALGFLGMYRFARLWLERPAALVAALLFMGSAYRLSVWYVRGDLAEGLGSALLLFVLAQAVSVFRKASARGCAILGLLLALVLLTHTLSGVMAHASVGLVALSALLSRKWQELFALAGALVMGVLLASAYWVPAFFERAFVHDERLLGFHPRDFFYPLIQRVTPNPDYISFSDNLLALAAGGVALWWTFRKPAFRARLGALALAWVSLEVLMTSPSAILWSNAPILPFFQFPWRLLSMATPLVVVLAGGVLERLELPRPWTFWLAGAGAAALPATYFASEIGRAFRAESALPAIVLLGMASMACLVTVALTLRACATPLRVAALSALAGAAPLALACSCKAVLAPEDVSGGASAAGYNDAWRNTTAVLLEYDPLTLARDLRPRGLKNGRCSLGDARITLISQTGPSRVYQVELDTKGAVHLPQNYYPGFSASVDSQEVSCIAGDAGLLRLEQELPAGVHTIETRYSKSKWHHAGVALSGAGCVLAVLVMVISLRRAQSTPGGVRA